jgi:pseudouridine-5'-phosphate glycosidase
MNLLQHKHWKIRPDIERALNHQQPVVALETAVVTHGLPYPTNLELARSVEAIVRSEHALPATIGVLDGKMIIGLEDNQLETLADPQTHVKKISPRDIGLALATGLSGGTTVGASIVAAAKAGLRVFATGGIGGVHREPPFDISADLITLHDVPMIVVCSGAKSILNLPATLELLESYGIPVLGYQTDQFPAFYAANSGLKVTAKVDSVKVIAKIAREQWLAGLRNAILVVQPPPAEDAMPTEEMEEIISHAITLAAKDGIQGAALTPYLLNRVNDLSHGHSLIANLALLKNNARLAAQIACAYSPSDHKTI